ncbi:uncharacterized protein LOC123686565 [Harmonia axyridis]|uniref:uncharacterized protein LOC123686565 n=1 Tax=Harmonia axyridis TaxID=115357 RepID=UPI001E2793BF|nr:uncharacterized protein LOC123686565 [Harmonia axyridis]
MVVLKGPRSASVTVTIKGAEIKSDQHMDYLGVRFTRGGEFSGHIRAVTDRTRAKVETMRKLMPKIGGPGYVTRRILCSVMHGQLLYAATVWRDALKVQRNMQRMVSTQRLGLLRVASAYRTVSAEAVQVISGYPPIDLMVAKRCFLYTVGGRLPGNRRMARVRTIKKWQERWRREDRVAGWT